MKAIYKYQLEIKHNQTIEIPIHHKILCCQVQKDIPCLWVEVNVEQKETESVTILMYGTGYDIIDTYISYVGTIQLLNGDIVYHVYIK